MPCQFPLSATAVSIYASVVGLTLLCRHEGEFLGISGQSSKVSFIALGHCSHDNDGGSGGGDDDYLSERPPTTF